MAALLWLIVVTTLLGVGGYYVARWRMRAQLATSTRPLDDPALQSAIDRLAHAAGVDGLRAKVLDMPMVNGLATPDGDIILTRGLVERYRFGSIEAAEIASVVAHEIGHVALGHHQRRMIDHTGQNIARLVLTVLFARFLPIIGIYIAAWLGNLLMAGLSRRDEFEADRFATALMIKAGFGHAPQIAMFRKLERMLPGQQAPAWLMSHPPMDQRVAAIEANARAWAERRAVKAR